MAAARPRIRYAPEATNLGFAGGMNAGVALARGDWVCLVNSDTLFPAGALAALKAALQSVPPEVAMVGPVTKITLAKDGKSATAVLKDAKSGETATLTVTDELTLDKFKDKRIVEGDEIRARWEKDGKNTSKSFKKTAGC